MELSQTDFASSYAAGARACAPIETIDSAIPPDGAPQAPVAVLDGADNAVWARMVQRIHDGDAQAGEQLYALIRQGFGRYLARRLSPAAALDSLQEVMVCVLEAIRRDRVRHPQALIAFIQTIVRRRACDEIVECVEARRRLVSFQEAYGVCAHGPDPEQECCRKQRQALLRRLLRGLPGRSREILVRSYLYEQSPEQICREMRLTPTQYRLLKSRSKARLEKNSRGLASCCAAAAFSAAAARL